MTFVSTEPPPQKEVTVILITRSAKNVEGFTLDFFSFVNGTRLPWHVCAELRFISDSLNQAPSSTTSNNSTLITHPTPPPPRPPTPPPPITPRPYHADIAGDHARADEGEGAEGGARHCGSRSHIFRWAPVPGDYDRELSSKKLWS